jgi:hypothetical protein
MGVTKERLWSSKGSRVKGYRFRNQEPGIRVQDLGRQV